MFKFKVLVLTPIFLIIHYWWTAFFVKLFFDYNITFSLHGWLYEVSSTTLLGSIMSSPYLAIPVMSIVVFVEELFFRYMPLSKSMSTGNGGKILRTVLISSSLFGIIHAIDKWMWQSLILQTGGGLIFCIYYILIAGKKGEHEKAFASSVVLHVLFNLVAFFFVN